MWLLPAVQRLLKSLGASPPVHESKPTLGAAHPPYIPTMHVFVGAEHTLGLTAAHAAPSGRMAGCSPCSSPAAAASRMQHERGPEGDEEGHHRSCIPVQKRHAPQRMTHAVASLWRQQLPMLLLVLAASSCVVMTAAADGRLDDGQCCTAPPVITGSKPRPKR